MIVKEGQEVQLDKDRLTRRSNGIAFFPMCQNCKEDCMRACFFLGAVCMKLARYEDAEAEGLLIRAPVGIGRPAWMFSDGELIEVEVIRYEVDRQGVDIATVKETGKESAEPFTVSVEALFDDPVYAYSTLDCKLEGEDLEE